LLRYFHVVARNASEAGGWRSQDQIIEQLDVLNRAYNKHNIPFKYAGTTQTVNLDWAENCAEVEMKNEMHRGTYADLNIYLHPNIGCMFRLPTIFFSRVFGYGKHVSMRKIASAIALNLFLVTGLPDTTTPKSKLRILNGVHIRADTLPFSASEGVRGMILVHETGHWLGCMYTRCVCEDTV
jgi:hypothetical protein